MRTVHFENCEVSVHGSPWALVLYKREFGKDWYEAYEQAAKSVETNGFFDQAFLLETCWAMGNMPRDPLPPFDEWAYSLEANMALDAPWTGEVMAEIISELFRITIEEEKETE